MKVENIWRAREKKGNYFFHSGCNIARLILGPFGDEFMEMFRSVFADVGTAVPIIHGEERCSRIVGQRQNVCMTVFHVNTISLHAARADLYFLLQNQISNDKHYSYNHEISYSDKKGRNRGQIE